jgi:ADP-ribose pyrophosphatase
MNCIIWRWFGVEVSCRGRRVLFESFYETLPSGVRVLVDRVTFPNSVAVLPVMRGSREVVLVRQYRPAIGRWILEAPAGVLRPGEDPREAAARELEEEAGLVAGELEEVAGGYVSPGYSTEYMRLYIAWDPSVGTPRREPHEVIEVERFNLSEALKMIYDGSIVDVKTITLILLAHMKLSPRSSTAP